MIAIDWGTTSFRAYRLGLDGQLLESRSAPKGILAVSPGGFAEVLETELGDWIGDAPIVMSGMVGSRQGWVEVPYVPCPAGLDEIAAGLREVRKGVWVVPGVSCTHAVPDVMRGEEVQALGAGVDGLICLPGTHSKWVEVKDARIERFSTHMTGELYALLRQHSILGRMMEEGKTDIRAFREGVERSGSSGGLLHHLFGVRARGLMGELGATASASYLSGLLIGHELRAFPTRKLHLLGAPELVQMYRQAGQALGIEMQALEPTAGTRALFRLGVMLRA